MRLVRQFDIKIQDLPYIEGHYFAVEHVKSAIQKNDLLQIFNLDKFFDRGIGHNPYAQQTQYVEIQDNHPLIREIEAGFVLLVHTLKLPFSPIVEFIPSPDNPNIGLWQTAYRVKIYNRVTPHLQSLIESMPNNRTVPLFSNSAAGPSDYQNEGSIESAPAERPAPLPDIRTQKWIQLEIFDQNTGLPIPGVTLNIDVPPGSKKESGPYSSDAAGRIDVLSLTSGKCHVKSAVFQSYKNTLAYVRNGKPGSQSSDQSKKLTSGDYTIAKVEEYQVKAGDTFASIADAKQMSESDIAQFNWNTTDQKSINQYLIDDVGGTPAESEQGVVRFTDEEDLGFILIPSVWENSSVSTMSTLTLTVRQVMPYSAHIRILYQMDIDYSDEIYGAFVLSTKDDQWEQTLIDQDVEHDEFGWMILDFTDMPKKGVFKLTYALDINDENAEEPLLIFEGFTYAELLETRADLQIT